jgi:Cu2+-exporting ATPase
VVTLAVPTGDPRRPLAGKGLDFLVRGASCAGCMGKIERAVQALPGVAATRFNLTTGKLAVQPAAQGLPEPAAIIQTLEGLGYQAAAYDVSEARASADREGRRLLMALGVAGFGAGNVMMFSVPVWAGLFGQELDATTRTIMYWFGALVATPCTLFAAQTFFRSATASLRRGKANMDVPISIGVLLTLAISFSELIQGGPHAYFDAAVSLVFFLLLGRVLDHRLRRTAASAAGDLLALQAPVARRLEADGTERTVPVGEIDVGHTIVAAPGDRIPVDGVVVEGRSGLDNALITGETATKAVGPGDKVHAGALSLSGRLVIRATAASEDSTIAALARLMEAGAQTRSRYVVMADRAAALYVPVIHGLAALALLGALTFGLGWREALIRAATVLIVTCPCALGLAAPAVQITASGRLFRKGVLVKSGAALERLAEVDCVVFDKTGVLTRGRPQLVEGSAEALALAAPQARASRPPLARALAAAAGPGDVASEVMESPGLGLIGTIDGRLAKLGRASFVGVETSSLETELWFTIGDQPPVRFAFADGLRSDAAATVRALAERGLTVSILSGDVAGAVAAAADEAGISAWRAGLTPAEKFAVVAGLRDQGRRVLMVGDGLNDAAALSEAHASMAPGTAVDASQNAADLVFCGENLDAVVLAIDVARAARTRARENFGFSALYNLVAAPAAILGLVNPLVAALAMSGSSVLVTLNALRMSFAGKAR